MHLSADTPWHVTGIHPCIWSSPDTPSEDAVPRTLVRAQEIGHAEGGLHSPSTWGTCPTPGGIDTDMPRPAVR